MDLALPEPPATFVSRARRAGDAGERWAARNLYCARCGHDHLRQTPTNEKVVDFECPACSLRLQLKSKRGAFGSKFANSAYEPKMAAIRARTFPDYALLGYDALTWRVRNLTLVPGFFLTERVIERRKPLSPTARRAGWVGSNVVLSMLPTDARVQVVVNETELPRDEVRANYRRFEDLRERALGAATWTVDTLEQVRAFAQAPGTEFTVQQFYAFAEPKLARLHPENRHVRDKIRQQLQVLRDRGVLLAVDRGLYRVV